MYRRMQRMADPRYLHTLTMTELFQTAYMSRPPVAEGLLYGFGIWWFNYLYIWPLLVALVMPLRKWSHPVLWAIVAGLFGLLFGTLCSIPYFITGGPGAGFGYIVSGIPFDLVHCAGNFVSVLILFYPLDQVLKKYL